MTAGPSVLSEQSRTPNGWRFGPGLARAVCLVVAGGFFVFALAHGADAQEDSQQRFDNEYCLGCHGAPGLTTQLGDGTTLDLAVDREVFGASVHGTFEMPCVLCHAEIRGFPHDPIQAETGREFTLSANAVCGNCHFEEFAATQDNVHAAALAAGESEAATCSDCHGAHDTGRPVAHSPEIPLTCRTCHSEIYDLYEESVHGAALETGIRDVPTCTDCHGVHEVEGPGNGSPFHLFSPQICAECHADVALMNAYGISTDVFESYVADFHGETVVLFEELAPDQETNKPVCIDCHGVHAIRAADDAESSVFRANILATCQRCHPDAEENFPTAWLSHYIPEPGAATLVFAVTLFYRILIPVVIGAMLLYVLFNLARVRLSRRKERRYV